MAQQLAPVANTVKFGCLGCRSHLGHTVLSHHVASVHSAGCLAVIQHKTAIPMVLKKDLKSLSAIPSVLLH